jgi:formylglycine-generating enzyme required for sulfatase activity
MIGKEFSWGDDWGVARDYANFGGISVKDQWEYCAPVGSLKPNGYGLFDMVGNTWEWCADWYSESYYVNSPVKNPQGPSSPAHYRVLRGGSWLNNSINLRVAYRGNFNPTNTYLNLGFRCVSGFPAAQQ